MVCDLRKRGSSSALSVIELVPSDGGSGGSSGAGGFMVLCVELERGEEVVKEEEWVVKEGEGGKGVVVEEECVMLEGEMILALEGERAVLEVGCVAIKEVGVMLEEGVVLKEGRALEGGRVVLRE
jgi:hypothetical protein